MNLVETINSLRGDFQYYHSSLQIDRFITARAGMTLWGCYRQALREMFGRLSLLRESWFNREMELVKIDELRSKIKTEEAKPGSGQRVFVLRRWRLMLTRQQLRLQAAIHREQDVRREFGRFLGQAIALREKFHPLTPEERERLDLEHWTHALKWQAFIDMTTSPMRSTRPQTFEAIMTMPNDQRVALLQATSVGEFENLSQWALNHPPAIEMPPFEPVELPQDDLKRIVRETLPAIKVDDESKEIECR